MSQSAQKTKNLVDLVGKHSALDLLKQVGKSIKRSLACVRHKRFIRTIRFCQTGKPFRFLTGVSFMMQGMTRKAAMAKAREMEPLKAPFQPFEQKCFVLKSHDDGSMDVMSSKPLLMSNGNGHTLPLSFYHLKSNGEVSYYFPKGRRFDVVVKAHSLHEQTELRSWSRNIPVWKCVDYSKAAVDAVLLILCAHRFDENSLFSTLPVDLVRHLGHLVISSEAHLEWGKLWHNKRTKK